jgi:hypothetical protein
MSRDVRWLRHNYAEWKYKQDDDDDSDEDEGATQEQLKAEEYQDEKETVDTTTTIEVHEDDAPLDSALARANVNAPKRSENVKLVRAMSKLGAFFNPDAQQIKDDAIQQTENHEATSDAIIEKEGNNEEDLGNVAMDRTIQHLFGNLALFVKDTMLETKEANDDQMTQKVNQVELQHFKDVVDQLDWLMGPDHGLLQDRHAFLMQHVVMQIKEQEATTYDHEAWNHPNLKIRKKYRDGIHKEFRKMNERKVWRKTMRQVIPQGRRCVKCRWVFEIKRNGIFHCRLVACRYSQIPGIDFTETFLPVINDIT